MMSSLGGDKARGPREKALPVSAHTSQPQKQIQVSHCIPKTTVLWNADILREKSKKKPNKPQHNHDKQFIWRSVLKSIFFCFDCSFTIMHFILWQYKVISDNSKQTKHLNSFSLYFTYFIPHFSLGKSCQLFLCYRLLLSRSGLLRWSMIRMMLTLRAKLTRLVTLK